MTRGPAVRAGGHAVTSTDRDLSNHNQGGEINSNGRRSGGDEFLCASLAEALPHLRRPPTAPAVRFKVQKTAQDAAQVAAYNGRLVFDRLDHVAASGGPPASTSCRRH